LCLAKNRSMPLPHCPIFAPKKPYVRLRNAQF
jgi:hypothetical protein